MAETMQTSVDAASAKQARDGARILLLAHVRGFLEG
jgi:hypothetical protein